MPQWYLVLHPSSGRVQFFTSWQVPRSVSSIRVALVGSPTQREWSAQHRVCGGPSYPTGDGSAQLSVPGFLLSNARPIVPLPAVLDAA